MSNIELPSNKKCTSSKLFLMWLASHVIILISNLNGVNNNAGSGQAPTATVTPLSFGADNIGDSVSSVQSIDWLTDYQEAYIFGQITDKYTLFQNTDIAFENQDTDNDYDKRSAFLARVNLNSKDDLRAVVFAYKDSSSSSLLKQLEPHMLKVGKLQDENGNENQHIALAFKYTISGGYKTTYQQLFLVMQPTIINDLNQYQVSHTERVFELNEGYSISQIVFVKKWNKVFIHMKHNCGSNFCSQFITTYIESSKSLTKTYEFQQVSAYIPSFEYPVLFKDFSGNRLITISAIYRIEIDPNDGSQYQLHRGFRFVQRDETQQENFKSDSPQHHFYFDDNYSPQLEHGTCIEKLTTQTALVFFSLSDFDLQYFVSNKAYTPKKLQLNVWYWDNVSGTVTNHNVNKYHSSTEDFANQRNIVDCYMNEAEIEVSGQVTEHKINIKLITQHGATPNAEIYYEEITVDLLPWKATVQYEKQKYTSVDTQPTIFKIISNNQLNIIQAGQLSLSNGISNPFNFCTGSSSEPCKSTYGDNSAIGIIYIITNAQFDTTTEQNQFQSDATTQQNSYQPDQNCDINNVQYGSTGYNLCNVLEQGSNHPLSKNKVIDEVLVNQDQLDNFIKKNLDLNQKVTPAVCPQKTVLTRDTQLTQDSSGVQISRDTVTESYVTYQITIDNFYYSETAYCNPEFEVLITPWYNSSRDEENNIFYVPKNDSIQKNIDNFYPNGLKIGDLIEIGSTAELSADLQTLKSTIDLTLKIKDGRKVARLVGEYSFKLTMKQIGEDFTGTEWKINATIIEKQFCNVTKLNIKSLNGPFSTTSEISSNPSIYQYQVGSTELLQISFNAEITQEPSCGPDNYYSILTLTESDNENVQSDTIYLPMIFKFDQFAGTLRLTLPSNITDANLWAGKYMFKVSYVLFDDTSMQLDNVFEFGIQILQGQVEEEKKPVKNLDFQIKRENQTGLKDDENKVVDYKSNLTKEEKANIKPIRIWIDEMTREGVINIAFNQKIKIPQSYLDYQKLQNQQQSQNDYNNGKNNYNRRLNQNNNDDNQQQEQGNHTNQQFDINKVFDISFSNFESGQGEEQDDDEIIIFEPVIIEWTEYQVSIQLNLQDPLLLSRTASGEPPDIVSVQIKNQFYFISQESQIELDEEYAKFALQMIVPVQLPKGVSEEQIKSTSNSQEKTLQIIIIIAALFMKAGSQRLINMVMAIQIISYMPLYKVDFPAELQLYIDALRKIAEFDILPTQEIKDWLNKNDILIFGKDKSQDQIVEEQVNKSAGFNSFNPLENLFGFLIIIVVVVLVLMIFCLLALIKKYKEKIMKKLIEIRNQFIWSGVIKSIILTYLKSFVSLYLALNLMFDSKRAPQADTIITTLITGLPLIIFPFWSFIFLYRNKKNLLSEQIKLKYSGLYLDLKHNPEKHSTIFLLYPSLFAFRRISYVLAAMVSSRIVFINIIVSIILSFTYFIWIEHVKPFQSRRQLQLETVNELLILLLCYHMICFTDLTSVEMQIERIQASYLVIVATLIGINLFALFYDSFNYQTIKREIEKKMATRKQQKDQSSDSSNASESNSLSEQEIESEKENEKSENEEKSLRVQVKTRQNVLSDMVESKKIANQQILENVQQQTVQSIFNQPQFFKNHQKKILHNKQQKIKRIQQMQNVQKYIGMVENGKNSGKSGQEVSKNIPKNVDENKSGEKSNQIKKQRIPQKVLKQKNKSAVANLNTINEEDEEQFANSIDANFGK